MAEQNVLCYPAERVGLHWGCRRSQGGQGWHDEDRFRHNATVFLHSPRFLISGFLGISFYSFFTIFTLINDTFPPFSLKRQNFIRYLPFLPLLFAAPPLSFGLWLRSSLVAGQKALSQGLCFDTCGAGILLAILGTAFKPSVMEAVLSQSALSPGKENSVMLASDSLL